MNAIELDASDRHRITYHEFDPQSDKLVICFADQGGGMAAEGFGTKLCRKHGWNHIYVGKAYHTKFQSLSLDRFNEAVSPLLAGRDVITYGVSAGGYGALYYGGIINARILSAAPRNGRHPINSKALRKSGNWESDLRGGEYFTHSVALKSVPRTNVPPVIVYDRRQSKDHRMVMAWALPAYPDARIINVANSGHSPLKRLQTAGQLSYLVRSFVENTPIDEQRLVFPEGTIDRQIDDGLAAYEDGRFAEAAELLDVPAKHLQETNLLAIYALSAAQSGSPRLIERLSKRMAAGEIRVEKLPGKTRQKVRAALP